MMGLDFFRRVVEPRAQHARPGQVVRNTLQTNATLLDDDWAEFLRTRLPGGVSVDGPRELDTYRVDRGGKPTFRPGRGRPRRAAAARGGVERAGDGEPRQPGPRRRRLPLPARRPRRALRPADPDRRPPRRRLLPTPSSPRRTATSSARSSTSGCGTTSGRSVQDFDTALAALAGPGGRRRVRPRAHLRDLGRARAHRRRLLPTTSTPAPEHHAGGRSAARPRGRTLLELVESPQQRAFGNASATCRRGAVPAGCGSPATAGALGPLRHRAGRRSRAPPPLCGDTGASSTRRPADAVLADACGPAARPPTDDPDGASDRTAAAPVEEKAGEHHG